MNDFIQLEEGQASAAAFPIGCEVYVMSEDEYHQSNYVKSRGFVEKCFIKLTPTTRAFYKIKFQPYMPLDYDNSEIEPIEEDRLRYCNGCRVLYKNQPATIAGFCDFNSNVWYSIVLDNGGELIHELDKSEFTYKFEESNRRENEDEEQSLHLSVQSIHDIVVKEEPQEIIDVIDSDSEDDSNGQLRKENVNLMQSVQSDIHQPYLVAARKGIEHREDNNAKNDSEQKDDNEKSPAVDDEMSMSCESGEINENKSPSPKNDLFNQRRWVESTDETPKKRRWDVKPTQDNIEESTEAKISKKRRWDVKPKAFMVKNEHYNAEKFEKQVGKFIDLKAKPGKPHSYWGDCEMCLSFHITGHCMSSCKNKMDHRECPSSQLNRLLQWCEE